MNGTLFSQDFLATGITQTAAWNASDADAFRDFVHRLKTAYRHSDGDSRPNEPPPKAS
jgi:hypothetical protein